MSNIKNVFINIAFITVISSFLMTTGCAGRQRLSFGIISDVHYADKESWEDRKYQDSLTKLALCVGYYNNEKPDFVIQLGDLIDGGQTASKDLDAALGLYNRIKTDRYHVLGNHEFSDLDRETVLKRLGMDRAYYDFTYRKWRFVVLDTLDYSVNGGWDEDSDNYKLGAGYIEKLAKEGASNAQEYNGAIGGAQRVWLNDVLSDARRKKQNVIVFGHHPLVPAGDKFNLLNDVEIVKILESFKCIKAYINGHRHGYDYKWQNDIYYVTIESMVESNRQKLNTMVEIYDDRIEINSTGKLPKLVMPLDE